MVAAQMGQETADTEIRLSLTLRFTASAGYRELGLLAGIRVHPKGALKGLHPTFKPPRQGDATSLGLTIVLSSEPRVGLKSRPTLVWPTEDLNKYINR